MEQPLSRITEEADLEAALALPLAILYKHSPACGLSMLAARQVQRFSGERPEIPTFAVDVIGSRAVSDLIERQLSVRHESPQVIVVRHGVARWSASHLGIRVRQLRAAVEDG
ncbi:MAG: bacillithiol system redox-active protein YtxJ [Gemmatimonadota bacterium]